MQKQFHYQDRGVKKWQPFFSSPQLASHAKTYQASSSYRPTPIPDRMSREAIQAVLAHAVAHHRRVRVTLDVLVEGGHVYYLGHVTGQTEEWVMIEHSLVEYDLIRHIQLEAREKAWEAYGA